MSLSQKNRRTSSATAALPKEAAPGLFDNEPAVLTARPIPTKRRLSSEELRLVTERVMRKKAELLARPPARRTARYVDVTKMNGELRGHFATHEKDTGSVPVQIAQLTRRIAEVTTHLQMHRQDKHSRRGLEMMANRRRKLLSYLRRHDAVRYRDLLVELGLRGS
jgi:small subunit ribosomal protein S15